MDRVQRGGSMAEEVEGRGTEGGGTEGGGTEWRGYRGEEVLKGESMLGRIRGGTEGRRY